MCHVLAEEGPSGFDVRVVLAVAAVAETAGRADPVEQRLVAYERRQVEHAAVAALGRGGRIDALGSEAVVAQGGRHLTVASSMRPIFAATGSTLKSIREASSSVGR